MCGVCKSIPEWTGGRDKSLSKEPRREGGGGRGTKTTTTAATTAAQHGGGRGEAADWCAVFVLELLLFHLSGSRNKNIHARG